MCLIPTPGHCEYVDYIRAHLQLVELRRPADPVRAAAERAHLFSLLAWRQGRA